MFIIRVRKLTNLDIVPMGAFTHLSDLGRASRNPQFGNVKKSQHRYDMNYI